MILSGDMEDTRFIKRIVDIEKNSQANLKYYKQFYSKNLCSRVFFVKVQNKHSCKPST